MTALLEYFNVYVIQVAEKWSDWTMDLIMLFFYSHQ